MDRRENALGIEREKVNYAARKVARRVLLSLAVGGCAYFAGLAELPFGARPFGVALLAASGREAVFVYVGLVISAFTALEIDEAIIYFTVYSVLLMLRAFSRFAIELRGENELRRGARRAFSTVFREKIGLRVITSAVFGVAQGAAMLFSGGLLYYDLFGLLIIALLSPAITLLLCGFTEGRERKNESERQMLIFALGFVTLCGMTVFGAREINAYGVSLSVLFALTVTFFVTCRYNVGYGSVCGLLLGLCYSPMLAPLFVISALCMGILARFSIPLACFAAFFASCAWAFYVEGISALLGVFGGILSACLLFSALYKMTAPSAVKEKKSEAKSEAPAVRCRVLPDSALDGVRLYEMNAKMSAISDGLYRLSLFFEELKANGYCDFNAEFCGEKYNDACFNDFNAPEYKALSALLVKSMESKENEYSVNRELSQRLCDSLSNLRVEIVGVVVYGVRKKTIYIKGKNRDALKENARAIIDAIAPLVPFVLDVEKYDVRREGENGGALLIVEREKLAASVVRRRVNAQDEAVCGDSVSVFKNNDDRFFAFISDGMGTGRTASAVSKISVGFLGNMLRSGNLSSELVELLNGFLCARMKKGVSECSATLDLFELDLMNGRAFFYKCGAAPSYIYRRGRLFKLRSESMPVGILNDVDLKRFELELSRGDAVVMVSDGVTGEGGECPWLFDLLSQNIPSRGLERTAELIVKYATAKGSQDDITVLLVKIE